jgi:hypothetical protein
LFSIIKETEPTVSYRAEDTTSVAIWDVLSRIPDTTTTKEKEEKKLLPCLL